MIEEYKYVVDNSKYVSIDKSKIEDFIIDIGKINYTHWSNDLNLTLNEKEWIILAFLIESLNFCFWKKPKWKINYKNEILSGSNALFYALIQQVEKDKKFLDIEKLSNINQTQFNNIFNGIDNTITLIDKRYDNFIEVINYIKSNKFFNELYSLKNDIEIRNFITRNFKSFDDKSHYKGRTIHFHKRANLLTNDLYYLSKTIRSNINNVNNLYGCADYGIPRVFRDNGLLIYNKELTNLIDNEQEVPHDSEMEIEIRANVLYIIELIKEKLNEKGIKINSIELDNIIWSMGKKNKDKSKVHHTTTIYY